jgi:hypothetical protein
LTALLLVLAAPAAAAAQGQEEPADSVVQAAVDAASAELGVPAENLIVVMSAQRDWADTSLGCPEPGRTYAQVITPGYVVIIDTDDLVTEIQVNTDTDSRAAIC